MRHRESGAPHSMTSRKSATGLARLAKLEHRSDRVLGRRRFAARMGLAIGLWVAVIVAGLAIGMAGYAYFEGMGWVDSFVNAAMILSGMGVFDDLKNPDAKIFAGFYALLSGLILLIAATFILAPVFHRVLHRFHVDDDRSMQD
jgi:sterol desaturase/sphingolipid hydroxylase (fatty acid hydroxylase superfamily)